MSPSCIEAQCICCHYKNHNWAGVVYGELGDCLTPYCPCYTFARIECVFERVCLNHTTINYVGSKNGANAISIWVALSPYGPSNAFNERRGITGDFLQAGIIVCVTPTINGNEYKVYVFACEYCTNCLTGSRAVYTCNKYVGIFSHACFFIAICKVNMPLNEARVAIAVLTPKCYKILLCLIVPWIFPYFAHSAYTIVESPENAETKEYCEVLQVVGGLIKCFRYMYCNGQIGPGPSQFRLVTVAYVFCLTEPCGLNNMCVTLAHGAGYPGNWCYTYRFYNTVTGKTTCGL
ncbi:hypothetical protein DDW13_06395 [Acidianus hospitalis]|uniref:Uncharacterized protein n=1 Tax=Acidianus hospitalis TaxID=563177 RepID=A0A2T9X3Q1_9CREN|nr:hypothetical protein DDW13_06395 [Acidianus hospitalis]